MKDSGLPWIGQIPSNWRCVRGKYALQYLQKPPKESDGVITCFRDGEVTLRSNRREDGFTISEKEIGYQGIDVGDLVVHGMDGFAGAIGISDSRGKASPVLVVLDSTENKRFLMYYLRNLAYRDVFLALATGIRVRSCDLRWNKIADTVFVLPPVEEQNAIVSFIDNKLSEIDAAIKEAQELIDKYKSYKQSIITEAVTKGLDSNVPMKDSGVEWIGEIPHEWKIGRFVSLNWIRARLGWKGLKADEYTETGFPFLSAYNIINYKLDWSNINYINQDRYDESPEIKLNIGDIILVKDGAGIGKCARIDELPYGNSTVNGSIAVITPNKKLYYKYLCYYLQSKTFRSIINLLLVGMGVPHLTQANMKNIKTPLPSIEDQMAISNYLDNKCSQIDSIVSQKENLISQLQEYKKSIIFEYVTGKKEVPNG